MIIDFLAGAVGDLSGHRTRHHRLPLSTRHQQMEHRLFSRITRNWRGRPLETYQTIVNLIANTTTTTGLTVRADLNSYPTNIKLTDQQKKSIPITRHDFHGDWNYTIQRSDE
jgi:Rhodopirellula transposase DDE domain